MEGRPCRRRKVTALAHAAGMDWLSDLPDEILHRIMCFLNARQAVQTCVLSRRWRNLWRTVPCINAEIKEFHFVRFQRREMAFKRFVNRLLELRDPIAMMHTFWLRYHKMYSTSSSADANTWISHALQKQARVLEVVMYPCHQLVLDHSRFTSCYLRRIGFSGVRLDQGFFKQLEAGCPALEDLLLHRCTIKDDKISSQTLKVLTIDRTYFSIAIKATEVQKKSISAPSVTSPTMYTPEGVIPTLKDMPLLVTASVTFSEFRLCFNANDLHQCLRTISGVTNLEVNYQGPKKLKIDNNLQWCPEFVNVVNLTLGKWCLDANFYALTVFLQNSPKLQKLTLKLATCTWEIFQRITGELTERSFTCEHLKIIEVICLENDPQVISVKDFFASSGITSVQFHIKHWSQLKEDNLPGVYPHSDSVPLKSLSFGYLAAPTRATCSTKRRCVLGSHMEDDAAGWDWLSDLPEGVLHRIMSFLSVRQAVQTCVLLAAVEQPLAHRPLHQRRCQRV
uniref:F-box domain-containing protein n=1 Tax=Oryza punctata TaxID=4537 RepID=A0A0E0M566_ORYPU